MAMSGAFLNYFNGSNSYYFRLIKDFVLDYGMNNVEKMRKTTNNLHLT